MNIYRVTGIRHEAVAFGTTADDAISQAMTDGDIGDWEAPEVDEIPLPIGYALRPGCQSIEWLSFAMNEAWNSLIDQLDGLSDHEFFWTPVPKCWTVHQDVDGIWLVDYALPEPDPSPFTTIAWKIAHLASCKIMYHNHAFAAGDLSWEELDIPHTAADAIDWLKDGHARLKSALAGLEDADLEPMRMTNWGEELPTWRIFWVMIAHDLQHGAEIGCLRDLYRGMGSEVW